MYRSAPKASSPESRAPSHTTKAPEGSIVNAFSVDVEDYFHVGAFERFIARSDWSSLESRVDYSMRRLLDLLDECEVRSTMFVLGWVAERSPSLVREMQARGHELAIHGYDHRRVTTQTPAEFRQDVRKAKQIVEEISGEAVLGYRAPNASIVQRTIWALDILREEGFRYDSSIFPVRYRIRDTPRFPWLVPGDDERPLVEAPISTVRFGRINLPFAGGAYLRQFPLRVTRWGMRRLNYVERQPAILYIHPWEIDPEQPRQPVDRLTALRHYRNIDTVEAKLRCLLREFPFTTVRRVLEL